MKTVSALSAALLFAFTLPAAATVNKTWVSSTGADSGTCQFTAPCKTFQFAHDQTTAGGEIDVKDTGGYGPLVITKAISVVSGDGALASVSVPSGGTGITVNAGSQDKVVLEGLFLDGHGSGSSGIAFYSGYSLTIIGCHVRNVTDNGISIATSNATFFDIENTEVTSTHDAIDIAPSGSQINGTIVNAVLRYSFLGVVMEGPSNTTIKNSVLMGNGIGAYSSSGTLMIGGNSISENKTYGVITQSNGVIESYGDNYINANGTNVSGTIGSLTPR